MRKLILPLLILSFVTSAALAQDFPFGEIDDHDLDTKQYAADTAAHAVILNEYASTRFVTFGEKLAGTAYQYHVRIKIFDKSGFSQGTVFILLHQNLYARNVDELRSLKGITFYKDEDGSVKSSYLDTTKTFKPRENNGFVTSRFTMPAIRAGCIIEYQFEVVRPNNFNIQPHFFQSNIPKTRSEYNVYIPSNFTYHVVLKGPLKLMKTSATEDKSHFSFMGTTNPCSHLIYEMDNVPAFVEEEYMTSPRNFLSSVNFELSDYVLYSGRPNKISTDWKDIDRTLSNHPLFGGQLDRGRVIKRILPDNLAAIADLKERAKAVYHFFQTSFKWDEGDRIYCEYGFDKLAEQHKGNVADINLALVIALRSVGLQAEPVLLSTRSNGVVDRVYPTIDNFNYVVAKTYLYGKEYFLDATDPLLPFGMLPLRCLNGQGRALSEKTLSYWTDIAETQKNAASYSFDLTLDDHGKISGTATYFSSGYEAYEQRLEMKKFNNIAEYVESGPNTNQNYNVVSERVVNLDSVDNPLSAELQIKFKAPITKSDSNRFSFKPFLQFYLPVNPFRMNARAYPVDFSTTSNKRITIALHLPPEYHVENLPADASYTIPDRSARFTTQYVFADNTVNFTYRLQIDKDVYEPSDYLSLKELFNKVILAQKSVITLVKIGQ